MSNVNTKVFSHTHYGVSTIAAVLYAIAWLVGNQVHAEASNATLSAVIVAASRADVSIATLDPIVVTGRRELQASYATLQPIIVVASRYVAAAAPTMQPAVFTASLPVVSVGASHGKGWIAKARNWVVTALLR